jgi:hypothetical protein
MMVESKFVTIVYDDRELLKTFYLKIKTSWLGSFGKLSFSKLARVDDLNSQVRKILMMSPDMNVKIVLLPNEKEVQAKYFELYNVKVSFKSFYSQIKKTLYLSVTDLNARMYAHEFAHAVIDHFILVNKLPTHLHELIAQYVEKKVN